MSISAGSYTVGSGGDYTNWRSAFADLATLTGDLTLTQTSDITDGSNCSTSVNMGGNQLNILSKHHGGVKASGYYYENTANPGFQIDATNGTCVVSGIFYKGKSGDTSNAYSIQCTPGSSATYYIVDCIIDGEDRGRKGYRVAGSSVCYMWNCIATRTVTGFTSTNGAAGSIVENCTFYDNATGAKGGTEITAGASNLTLRNILAIDNGSVADYIGLTHVSHSGCASSDTTGDADFQSITSGVFVSTVQSDVQFLELLPETSIGYNGVKDSITENTAGIRGTARPH